MGARGARVIEWWFGGVWAGWSAGWRCVGWCWVGMCVGVCVCGLWGEGVRCVCVGGGVVG